MLKRNLIRQLEKTGWTITLSYCAKSKKPWYGRAYKDCVVVEHNDKDFDRMITGLLKKIEAAVSPPDMAEIEAITAKGAPVE